jgi:hypothetical protein
MKNLLSKYYPYATLLCWTIVCVVFFQCFYSYHFFYKEQTQLFLLSSDYLATYFDKPAWLACMVGDFLTQFYYYEYAGVVILTLSLLLMGDLTRRACERCGTEKLSFWIALVVMTLEGLCYFSASFNLSSTYALTGAIALYLLYDLIPKGRTRRIIAIFALLLSYWMFGYGCFAFAIFAFISDIKQPNGWLAFALPLLAFATPPIMRGHYLLTLKQSLSYPGICSFRAPNFQLETILSLDNEYYFGNYDKVLRLARKTKYQAPEITYFYNLVQARRGTMADSLLSFPQSADRGLFFKSGPDMAMIDLYIEDEQYYLWGDMTFCEHSAILANVFSPNNRNVRMIKRLAEVNLINNDTTAAMKYLRILDKTMVYRHWAEHRMPGAQTANVVYQLKEMRQIVQRNDTIRQPNEIRGILYSLLRSNPKNSLVLDYLLCSELLVKDLPDFVNDYNTYCLQRNAPRYKRIYQEALMIYLMVHKAPAEVAKKYIYDPQVVRDFKDYTDIYARTRGNADALKGRFGKTYWYYFHFATMKKG